MNDEPLTEAVGDTQKALQEPQAWAEEPQSEDPHSGRPAIIAVAILAFLALGMAGVAGVVSLTPRQMVTVRPAPIETPARPVPVLDPAPPPSLDQDGRYLQLLVEGGIAIKDRSLAISGGHWTCSYLSDGHTARDTINRLDTEQLQDAAGNPWDHNKNVAFVNAAIKAYCPQAG